MRFTRTGGVMLMVLVSASGPSGSGNIVTEERELGDFDSIQVSGGIDLTLTIDQGLAPRWPSSTTTTCSSGLSPKSTGPRS